MGVAFEVARDERPRSERSLDLWVTKFGAKRRGLLTQLELSLNRENFAIRRIFD